MARKNFKKEEFAQDSNRYKVEFKKAEIGEGVDLVVEKMNEDGTYEIIQPEITREENRIFVFWSEPIDGRVITDEYKQL